MRIASLILVLVTLTGAWSWSRETPQGDDPVQLPEKKQNCQCQFTGGREEDEEDEVLNARLQDQFILLDKLEEELADVESNYEAIRTKAKDIIRESNLDETHLERLEGSRCQENEFDCGHHSQQCISAFLACDGYEDCRNGEDESKDLCKNPVPAGAILETYIQGDDHCTLRKPINIQVHILTSERPKHFRTIEHMRMSYVITYLNASSTETDVLYADAHYSYGKRTLVVGPPHVSVEDDADLMMEFTFDKADPRVARGILYTQGMKEDICLRCQMLRID